MFNIIQFDKDCDTEIRYDMIIGIYLLKIIGTYLRLYINTMECSEVLCQGFMAPMVDLYEYKFYPMKRKIHA